LENNQATPSYREIVAGLQDMVYNTALSIVQNAEDAEDITQEVFIKLYEELDHFRGEAKLSTWVYRITINKALDAERKRKAKKRGGFLNRVWGSEEDHEPAHFNHPGIELDKKEDAAVLFAALRKLPDNQRIAFLLHKAEGLGYAEIADIMKISVAAAESLQARAKTNLRLELNDYYQKHFK